jgi:hypothetical protein
MPATDEDIVRDLLHRYTDQVCPPASLATDVVARQRHKARRRNVSLAATGAAAAVAAGVIVAVPGHSPASRAPAGNSSTGKSSTVNSSTANSSTVNSKLVSLAAFITARSGPLPGNATLIITSQGIGGRAPQVTYNLYTDRGAYYAGVNESTLRQAIAAHANMAGRTDAREVAAARYAAAGDLSSARERMTNALPNNDYYDSLAQRKLIWAKGAAAREQLAKEKGVKIPWKMPAGQSLQEDIDNSIWNNSVDALMEGAGSPQVRAGVLRLLSTIPEVTVANSTTGGQPTLTLTAGSALFGGGAPQVLTINASTGMPVKSVFPANGSLPASVQTFKVSRVTMADLEAGKS